MGGLDGGERGGSNEVLEAVGGWVGELTRIAALPESVMAFTSITDIASTRRVSLAKTVYTLL